MGEFQVSKKEQSKEEKAEMPFRGSNMVWLVFGKRMKIAFIIKGKGYS